MRCREARGHSGLQRHKIWRLMALRVTARRAQRLGTMAPGHVLNPKQGPGTACCDALQEVERHPVACSTKRCSAK